MVRAVILEWSAAAYADLSRFAIFLRDEHPTLSRSVAAELVRKSDVLMQFPELGRSDEEDPEFREVVLRVLNASYVFQYRYDGRRLTILRVFHGREDRSTSDPGASG